MAFSATWDSSYKNDPADNSSANLLGQVIRNLKRDIEERLDLEFDWIGGTARRKIPSGDAAARGAISSPPDGFLFYRTDLRALQVRNSSHPDGWETFYAPIESTSGINDGSEVKMYDGTVANIPSGWAICDGSTVNGVVTPDMRSRMVIGFHSGGDADGDHGSIGEQGGNKKHTISGDELPDHRHTITDPGHLHEQDGARRADAGSGAAKTHGTSGFSEEGASDGRGPIESSTETTGITETDAAVEYDPGGGFTSASNAAIDIRPKYHVLAFIKWVGGV